MKRLALLAALLAGCDARPEPPVRRDSREAFGSRAPAAAAGAGAVEYESRHALVVGVSRYEGRGLTELGGTTSDAVEVAATLADRFGFRVRLLLDRDPGLPLPAGVNLERVEVVGRALLLARLAEVPASPKGAFWFYFAGHGLPGGIVPGDADLPGREDRASWKNLVTMEELGRALRKPDAHHTVAVLDCCFSGTALGSMSPAPLGPPAHRVSEAENLGRVFNRRSFQVLTAGAGDETVADLAQAATAYGALPRDLEGHSPFTGVLLQGLRGLTGRADGIIAASDLGYFLAATLVNENESFRARQAPRYAALAEGEGDFLLLPARRVLDPKLVAPLYMKGARYAELRESACRSLGRHVAEQPAADRPALTADVAPHLIRLLRDASGGVRAAAAEAVAELVAVAPEPLRAAVPILGPASAKGEPAAARALGALARYADEAAVAALAAHNAGLETAWAARLGRRRPPRELIEKMAVIAVPLDIGPPPRRQEAQERRREALAWLHREGTSILEAAEQRHARGREVLQRAERHAQERQIVEARLGYARALGEGAAPDAELWPGSPEAERAARLLENLPDLRLLWQSPALHARGAQSMALAPDGTLLATADREEIVVWRLPGGAPLARFRTDLTAMVFAGDGSLVTADEAGALRFWDPRTGRETDVMASGLRVFRLAAVDGRLAGADPSGTVVVWDLRTRSRLAAWQAHDDTVQTLAFLGPDRVATATRSELAFWELPSGRLLRRSEFPRAVSLALSPDGSCVAAGSGAGFVRLMDVIDEEKDRSGWVHAYDFANVADAVWIGPGRLAVLSTKGLVVQEPGAEEPVWTDPSLSTWMRSGRLAAAKDRLYVLWDGGVLQRDAATGRAPPDAPVQGWPLRRAAFAPDGASFATVSDGGGARLWSTATGRPVDPHPDLRTAGALAWGAGGLHVGRRGVQRLDAAFQEAWSSEFIEAGVSLLAANERYVAAANSGRVVLYSAEGVEVGDFWPKRPISGLALRPGDATLATADAEALGLWDAARGRLLWSVSGHFLAAIFDPTGRFVVASDFDDRIRWFSVASGEPVASLACPGRAYSLAYAADGLRFAAGSGEGRVFGWEVQELEDFRFHPLWTLEAHDGPVWNVEFSPDGRRLLTAGGAQARLWGVDAVPVAVRLPSISGGAVAADGRSILGSTGETIDLDTGRVTAGRRSFGAGSVALSPDGRLSVWTGKKVTVKGVDGQELPGPAVVTPVKAAAFSPDGKWLATAGEDARVRVWKVDGWVPVRDVGREFAAGYEDVAFSGGALIAETDGGLVVAWDEAGKELFSYRPAMPNFRGFAAGGGLVASGAIGDTIQVREIPSGRILRELRGHSSAVLWLDLAPDGSRLASAGLDGTVRVWNPRTGERLWTGLAGYPTRVWLVPGRDRLVVLDGLQAGVRDTSSMPPPASLMRRDYRVEGDEIRLRPRERSLFGAGEVETSSALPLGPPLPGPSGARLLREGDWKQAWPLLPVGPAQSTARGLDMIEKGNWKEAAALLAEGDTLPFARARLFRLAACRQLGDVAGEAALGTEVYREFEDRIFEALTGRRDEASLLDLALKERQPLAALGRAHYHLGAAAAAAGREEKARAHFEECARRLPGPCLEGDLARAAIQSTRR